MRLEFDENAKIAASNSGIVPLVGNEDHVRKSAG
jgi:hypothetical protein